MRVALEKYGDWEKAKVALGVDLKGAIRRALMQEAEFLTDKVREKLKSGPFTPLSPLTLRLRKLQGFNGTKILQRTGDLLNSIKAVASTDGEAYFVGILRTAQSKDGQSLANLGAIHENGQTIVIKVTPKMRKFFFGVVLKGLPPAPGGAGGGGFARGILVIHIPARPFLGPTFETYGPGIPDRFMKRLVRETKGVLGDG